MRQARAEETRGALLLAAAQRFDSLGYEGTSLVAISDLAAVSKGALSFHFSNKSELADAVQHLSCDRIRTELEILRAPDVPALQTLIDMTQLAAQRLATDPLTRAGLRLTRERASPSSAAINSRLALRTALDRTARLAEDDGSLRHGVSVRSVVELALSLVLHQEAVEVGEHDGTPCRACGIWLTEVWELLLPSLAPEDHPWPFRPAGERVPTLS